MTSTLAFDIAQFSPSLNHHLLLLILRKAGFNFKIEQFFSNYLIGRKTRYFWNNFSSSFFNVDMGVGQGSALSPILSALYLSPVIHIFEKQSKILKIPVSILSFVNNGLLITQSKSLTILNNFIFCSYRVTSLFLEKFSLILEYGKMEVFYFSESTSVFNPPLLNLSVLGSPILWSKNTWRYLGFFFNRKLSFHHHIDYYTNKVISTIKCMKILRNSTHGLIPH